jgi:UDP-2,3-diacylglucosamine hydrolase
MALEFTNALFISDLHLMEERPECIRAFFKFLEWIPVSTEALFILGDFFEYWVGDDIALPRSQEIAEKLKAIQTSKQLQIYFIPGNRDFSLGTRYCQLSGMTLIKQDELNVRISGNNVLLAHGDTYCTDDRSYQRFRKIIRNPIVLSLLLSLSKNRRIRIAEKLRTQSNMRYQKEQTIIDVTTKAVVEALHEAEANILVHGHTHMADIHIHTLENEMSAQRMVLGDWHHVGWYGVIDENGPTLHQFDVAAPDFDRP